MNAFWEDKTLGDMTDEEWELLCDGCARCCMIKLENEDDGTIHLPLPAISRAARDCSRLHRADG